MQLEAVAAGLIWIWSLLGVPADGLASRLVEVQPRIEQPRSARFELEVTVSVGPRSIAARGEGAFVQPDRAQLRLRALEEEYELIAIGETVYHRGPGERDWSKIGLDEAAERVGGATLNGQLGPDPGAARDDLEPVLRQLFGDHDLVGETLLAGAATQHYRASLDRERLAQLVREADQGGEFVLELLEGLSLGLDYYVGLRDHYLHGASLVAEFQPPVAAAGVEGLRLEAELRLSDFDAPIEIGPPGGPAPTQPAPTQPAPVQAPIQMPASSGR